MIAFNEAIFYLGDGAFRHLHAYSLERRIRRNKEGKWDADHGSAMRGNMSRYDETVTHIYMYLYM
jgi:hypothetical protein